MSDSFVPQNLTEWTTQARRDDWHMRFVGSDIRCMLAEIERLRETQRWRPIKTAAGDPVLLGFPRGLHALVGHFEGDKWGWLDDEMGFHPFVTQPIGWQPLPAPPQ